jgi:hypothetical protein
LRLPLLFCMYLTYMQKNVKLSEKLYQPGMIPSWLSVTSKTNENEIKT